MELSDVLAMLRIDLDDTVKEYLWGDEELIGYIDQGYKEFARVTEILTDQSTVGLTNLTVTANEAWLTLDPRIVNVRRAYLVTADRELDPANFNQVGMRERFSQPTRFITDQEVNKLRLDPGPTVADTLKLNVTRLPLESLEDDPDLEFHDRRYWQVINIMAASLAWRNPDVDTFDIQRAREADERFIQAAAEVRSEVERRTRTPGVIAYGGISDGIKASSDY